jgi:hypothetical protein
LGFCGFLELLFDERRFIMIRTTRPPIRIGIAGLGRAGLQMHIPELEAYPELFKIMAVCDPVKERRDLVLERYPECRTYRRYEDLLADPDVSWSISPRGRTTTRRMR